MRYIIFVLVLALGLNSFADDQNPIILRPNLGVTPTTTPPPTTTITAKPQPPKPNAYSTHVHQYRQGDKLITEIPLRDMTIAERAKAFELSQVLATKLLRAWFARVIGLQMSNQSASQLNSLEEKSAQDLEQYIKDQKLKGHMPTAEDIVNETSTALETNNQLKARTTALVSYDDLMNTLNQSLTAVLEQDTQNKTWKDKALQELPQVIPSAFMVVASYKAPSFLVNLLQSKNGLLSVAGKNLITGNAAAVLLKGSATVALTIRPTKRITTNLVTGEKAESYNFDWAVPVWLFKDFSNYKDGMFIPGMNGRIGVGALWGDFDNNLSNVGGVTVGRSMNFASKSLVSSSDLLPHNYNVKFGVLSAQVSNLTQALSLSTFLHGGYIMATKQWGVQAKYGQGNYWETGYAVNFQSLTDKVLINEETLDQLLIELAGSLPGTTATVENGKVTFNVPAQKPAITTQPSTTTEPGLIQDVKLKHPPEQQNGTGQEIPPTH